MLDAGVNISTVQKKMRYVYLQMNMHYFSLGKSHILTGLDSSDARREKPYLVFVKSDGKICR